MLAICNHAQTRTSCRGIGWDKDRGKGRVNQRRDLILPHPAILGVGVWDSYDHNVLCITFQFDMYLFKTLCYCKMNQLEIYIFFYFTLQLKFYKCITVTIWWDNWLIFGCFKTEKMFFECVGLVPRRDNLILNQPYSENRFLHLKHLRRCRA